MPEAVWSELALPPLQTLRLFDAGEEAVAAASRRVGFELAPAPGRLTEGAPRSMRLGPGEWLVIDASADRIDRSLEGVLHQVFEAGPGRAGFSVAGPAAADLLACGCSLDLHDRVFPSGACARTLLAGVVVVLARPHHGEGFEVVVERPLRDWLAAWLADAALGFA